MFVEVAKRNGRTGRFRTWGVIPNFTRRTNWKAEHIDGCEPKRDPMKYGPGQGKKKNEKSTGVCGGSAARALGNSSNRKSRGRGGGKERGVEGEVCRFRHIKKSKKSTKKTD